MQVLRYTFPDVIGEFDLTIKKKGVIVDVQRVNGNPVLFVLSEPSQEDMVAHFHLYHSNQTIPEMIYKDMVYLGTFQGQGGLYEYHLFREYPLLKISENKVSAAEPVTTDQTPAAA